MHTEPRVSNLVPCKSHKQMQEDLPHYCSAQCQLTNIMEKVHELLENKINLIQFRTKTLMVWAASLPDHQELNVARGCQDPEIVLSFLANQVEDLFCSREEADMTLILHAAHAAQNNYHQVLVCGRDTDALLLLIHHTIANEVWMDAGTTTDPIPYHPCTTCAWREEFATSPNQ